MASSSGEIIGTTSDPKIIPRVQWSYWQSTAENITHLNIVLYLRSTSDEYSISGRGSLMIDLGSRGYASPSLDVVVNSTNYTRIYSYSVVISHQQSSDPIDVDITVNGSVLGTHLTDIYLSDTIILDAIPTASAVSLDKYTADVGSDVVISISNPSDTLSYTLRFSCGDANGEIGTNVKDSITWTLPTSIAEALPSTTSGVVTITCETYEDSVLIGTKQSTLTATVPYVPAIDSVMFSDPTGALGKYGKYVQNVSQLQCEITASGVYGSTISSVKTVIEPDVYSSTSFTSRVLQMYGTVDVITTVTDSRGRSATVENTIEVFQYNFPTVNVFEGYRTLSTGDVDDSMGECLSGNISFIAYGLGGQNTVSWYIGYRLASTGNYTKLTDVGGSVNGDVIEYETNYISNLSVFGIDDTYEVVLCVEDDFTLIQTKALLIEDAFSLIEYGDSGKAICFGGTPEHDEEFGVNLPAYFRKPTIIYREETKEATLLNGWSNYGGEYSPVTYWKDALNVVHLSGLMTHGTTTSGTKLFDLPEGYRPSETEKHVALSNNAICTIDINADGEVILQSGGNTTWLSVSGITFRVET